MGNLFGVFGADGKSKNTLSPAGGITTAQGDTGTQILPPSGLLPEKTGAQHQGAPQTSGELGTIRRTATDLAELASGSEDEFLSVGKSLQEYYARAKEIHQIGKSAADLMSGREMMGSIDLLHEMTGEMKIVLQHTEGRQEQHKIAVQRVIGCLALVGKHLAGFDKIVVSLRFLGITTKIESARLAGNRKVFLTLADQVIEQSEKIDLKVAEITSELRSLGVQVNKTQARLLELDATQRGRGRQVIDEIAVSLTSLSDKQNQSSLSAKRISALAEEVSRGMGEIISSMQFHDITRQRIEHVQQALAELNEESPAGHVLSVCELQSVQIRHAGAELSAAVKNIIGCLHDMGQNITHLSLETLNLIGSADRDDSSFISEIEREVTAATDSLGEYHEVSGELLQAMNSVAHRLEAMAEFLKEIDGIGYSIKCIALNSAIKANVAGREEATIEVVSRGIRDLSQDASAQAEEISGAIDEITGVVETLREGMAQEMEGDDSEVAAFTKTLRRMLHSVREVNGRSLEQLARIDQSGFSLADDIENTANGISVHKVMERKLDNAAVALEQVSASAAFSAHTAPAARNGDLLIALADQYTMQKERDVHRSWMREAAGREPVDGEVKEFETRNGDDDLGDNVELF